MTVVARVPSLSDPRGAHDIYEVADELRCDCQAFASWKKRGLPCWHMRIWKSAAVAIARCGELGHRDGSTAMLCQSCLLALLAAMAGKVKRDYVEKAAVKAAAKEKAERARARKAAKRKPRKKKEADGA